MQPFNNDKRDNHRDSKNFSLIPKTGALVCSAGFQIGGIPRFNVFAAAPAAWPGSPTEGMHYYANRERWLHHLGTLNNRAKRKETSDGRINAHDYTYTCECRGIDEKAMAILKNRAAGNRLEAMGKKGLGF